MKTTAAASQPFNRSLLLLLLAILVLAAALRFWDIGAESYWLDESIMAGITASGEVTREEILGGRPPIYVLLGFAWNQVFGDSEGAVRSLSAVFGIASVFLVYLVGRQMADARVGLAAAFVCALSVFHIYYAQEHRYYSVLMFFTLLMFLFYLRAWEGGRWLDFLLFAVFSVAVVYTHTFGMFVLVVPALHFLILWLWRREYLLRWFAAEVLTLLAISPVLWNILAPMLGLAGSGGPLASVEIDPTAWITPPSLFSPVRSLANFLLYDWRLLEPLVIAAAAAVLVIGLGFMLVRRRAAWLGDWRGVPGEFNTVLRTDAGSSLLLLALWVILPILIPWLLSMLNVIGQVYLDRYLSPGMPGLAVLIGVAIIALRRAVPVWASAAAVAVLLGGTLVQYYQQDIKEEWREAGEHLSQNAQPGEIIATAYEQFPEYQVNEADALYRYYSGERQDCSLDLKLDNAAMLDFLRACDDQADHVWVVIHNDNPERMADFSTLVGEPLEVTRFLNLSLYRFALPGA